SRSQRMQLVAESIVADRFRLLQELGSGGMGCVWLAEHLDLGYFCAVKLIHAELVALPIVRARFEQEAKVAAQLQSPYIVRVLDYGMWGEVPYMAMEYLEGEDLDVRLRRCGRLDIDTTLAIVKQVARALAKAHAVGLVHRDLKPDNIFLV